MGCGHLYDWSDCSEHGCCRIATCEPCNIGTHLVSRHEVIRWLHSERVRGCEDCDSATEYEQGELTPCSISVCAACGEITDPATDAHHKQLLADA